MSSKNTRLRRAGIVGLSTVVATSMMTLGAASSFALPPAFSALSAPNVLQGGSNQAAGSLTLDFTNVFVTNAAQTFTIGGNDCATAPGIAAATEFSAAPTAALTGPFLAGLTTAGTATVPTFTTTLGSSTTQCETAGITDTVTLKLTTPSSVAGPTDWFKYTLSNVKYNVGASAALGAKTVASAGSFTAAGTPVTNAIVGNATFTSAPRVAALPSTTASVGTQTFTESSAGAYFPQATQTVTLTLAGGGTFTNGVTPTITVPAGYAATRPATTGSSATYAFTVTGIAVPVKATVSVSGLTADVDATVGVRTIAASGMNGQTAPAVKAMNVLNYNDRTGGATRYETAAALFNGMKAPVGGTNKVAVLARGDLFPDALSANYLAGKLGTGTLLTPVGTLSSAARLAILNNAIDTVYITGGTGAVSQAVENQIEALHVSNNPANPLIITVRLGGVDRYATNQIVNEHAFTPEATVLLASGLNFPDALAFGPIAAHKSMPLILTRGTTLGSREQAQLNDFEPTSVVIGGGTGVVSAAIETQLRTSYTVARLAGADRTGTAAAIATWATVGVGTGIAAAQGFSSQTTYVATGNLFPDALAAGPVAGEKNSVILLTYSGLGAGIPSYLGPKGVGTSVNSTTLVDTLHALGLSGAVTPATMRAAAATISVP